MESHGIATGEEPGGSARIYSSGGATKRRKVRRVLFDTQEVPQLHKIIIHNINNDPEPIGDAHDRFGALSKFLVPSSYACVKTSYPGIRIEPVNHIVERHFAETHIVSRQFAETHIEEALCRDAQCHGRVALC